MKATSLFFALATVVLIAGPAAAADLTEIHRTIAKEPAYKFKPKYCLLVFGPEAQSRVWLVLDRHVLYVDRNGNGDLTEADERIGGDRTYPQLTTFEVGAISAPDEKTRHTDFRVSVNRLTLLGAASDSVGLSITIAGTHWWATVKQFSEQSKDAPVVHFNGPLTFQIGEQPLGEQPTLVPGITTMLTIYVGTQGLGTRGLGSDVFARCQASEVVPRNAWLPAEIEFPSREPGGKPLRIKDTFPPEPGGGSTFEGTVRVPREAGPGKAKIALAFPENWNANVASATFELLIEE